MLFTPLAVASGLGRSPVADLAGTLDRFHAGLALRAGLVGLALAGALIATRRGHRPGRFASVGAAALVLTASEGVIDPVPALLAALLAAGLAIGDGRGSRHDSPLVGPLATVSTIGVWAAVPDTEAALVAAVLAVTVVGLTAVASRGPGTFGAGDRVVAIGLIAAAAWAGAPHRPELVGGLACVGLLVAPLPRRPGRRLGGGLVTLHTGIVVVSSRVLTRVDRWPAVVLAVALLAIGGAAERAFSRRAGDAPGCRTPALAERRRSAPRHPPR